MAARYSYILIFALTVLIGLVMGVVHWVLVHDRVQVCFDVRAEAGGVTRVYWDVGTGYKERQSVGQGIPAGKWVSLCFTHPGMRNIVGIRVDPVDQPTRFDLSEPRLQRLDSLVSGWDSQQLALHAPGIENDIQRLSPTGTTFRATGIDPYFGWPLPNINSISWWLLVTNSAIVCAFVWMSYHLATRIRGDHREHTVHEFLQGCTIYVLFGFFAGLAYLASAYLDLAAKSTIALYVCLVVGALFWFAVSSNRVPVRAGLHVACISALVFVVSFDMAYRVGIFDRPVFARLFSNDVYHWRLTRNATDNFLHSSMPYVEDLRRIRRRISAEQFFLSDLATSYYVAAALPLYATNVHPHHSRWYKYYRDVLRALCNQNPDKGESSAFDLLIEKAQASVAHDGLPVRYVFVNKDQYNKNVRVNCLTRNVKAVERRLRDFSKNIYTGEYIDVFEIQYPQDYFTNRPQR
jgi:hypothetical protein